MCVCFDLYPYFFSVHRKVFSKLNFHISEETVKRIVLSTAGVIEPVLSALREKIDKKLEHTTDNILVCMSVHVCVWTPYVTF